MPSIERKRGGGLIVAGSRDSTGHLHNSPGAIAAQQTPLSVLSSHPAIGAIVCCSCTYTCSHATVQDPAHPMMIDVRAGLGQTERATTGSSAARLVSGQE